MKTLYYKIGVREAGRFKNEGFLIVEIENGKLKSAEGVLAFDYIKIEADDEQFYMYYYVPTENHRELELYEEISEPIEDLELPIDWTIFTETCNYMFFTTKYTVKNKEEKECYKQQLEEFKKMFSL